MSTSPIGIIGGSGLYDMKELVRAGEVEIETPFGRPSAPYVKGSLSGVDVVFLARHGVGHTINPTEINARANVWGFKKLGVKQIFSVSAVGSLRKEIAPGHLVVPDQFIDRTRLRANSFF
jgi:5'-methylthioadenosine phosphorylase